MQEKKIRDRKIQKRINVCVIIGVLILTVMTTTVVVSAQDKAEREPGIGYTPVEYYCTNVEPIQPPDTTDEIPVHGDGIKTGDKTQLLFYGLLAMESIMMLVVTLWAEGLNREEHLVFGAIDEGGCRA